jgi:hypothetical protein
MVAQTYNQFGLGDASQAVGAAAGAASTTISTPAVATALGLSSSTAALIAGPVIGGIAIALMAWLNRKGPQQKIATTQIVNEAEPILAQNRDAFLAGPKTAADKEFAVAVYNKIWSEVVAMCSNPQMGNPGKACIADRQRGGRWDWASYYLDPILEVEPATPSVGSSLGLGFELPEIGALFSPGNPMPLVLGVGLIAWAIISGRQK